MSERSPNEVYLGLQSLFILAACIQLEKKALFVDQSKFAQIEGGEYMNSFNKLSLLSSR